MEITDIEIGQKVVPISKSIGAYSLNQCYVKKEMLRKGQEFAYVVGVKHNPDRVFISDLDGNDVYYSMFQSKDLEPYIEPTKEVYLKNRTFLYDLMYGVESLLYPASEQWEEIKVSDVKDLLDQAVKEFENDQK
jgi:hypothetical protein